MLNTNHSQIYYFSAKQHVFTKRTPKNINIWLNIDTFSELFLFIFPLQIESGTMNLQDIFILFYIYIYGQKRLNIMDTVTSYLNL